jgi:predicted dehydrogenase
VSRTIENARKFASMFEIPKSYGSYDEFASDPEIGDKIVFIHFSFFFFLIKVYDNQ